jgi:UDP-hydrolysing UDP-N-acetyl-D-glucosamine 2-epimerase
MTRIAVVTVARSDYGLYRPFLKALAADPGFELNLIVAGMHLMPQFGRTIEEIEADGFEAAATVDLAQGGDRPVDIAAAMGRGAVGFAEAYARIQPDLVVVHGDRFEMHAAAVAAVPFLIPIIHHDGGALTLGAIDDALRHSMTKLASLHFVETEAYAARVIQMGEEPWRVTVTGALGLDNLADVALLTPEAFQARFGVPLPPSRPPLLATFHPVTREYAETRTHMEAFLAAIEESGLPVVFTYPNADTGGQAIIEMIEAFVERHPEAWAVPHLGTQGYFSLMANAATMVGNSSSGIIEAASFKLPVVNVGHRQEGRLAPDNVITTGSTKAEILQGIRKAISPEFRMGLASLVNPYGDGHAAERMMTVLRQTDPKDPRLIRKTFHDLPRS